VSAPIPRETAAMPLSQTAVHRSFPDAFEARPAIYWADLLGSAALGWTAFAVAGTSAPGSWRMLVAGVVATLALYRAVLFIHELTHLKRGAVPYFNVVWDLLVGFPLMVPSLMYVGSHADHHRPGIYGTPLDPEYETIGQWSAARIVASSFTMLAVPGLLALRWGILGPVSYLVPPFRRVVVTYLSTLVINPSYARRAPRGRQARRWLLEETGAAFTFWCGVGGVAAGWIPLHWAVLWYAVGSGLLFLNHLRTLASHRYANTGQPLDAEGELLDSVNLLGRSTAIAAPVGLRYHALHHFLPALPYHSLGRVHRGLVRELAENSPYHRTASTGILATLADLLAGKHRAPPTAAPGPGADHTEPSSLSAARPSAAGETGSATRAGAGDGAEPR
jgi:fatty acid desaturase